MNIKKNLFLLSMAIPTFITGCSNPMTWADDYMTQKANFLFEQEGYTLTDNTECKFLSQKKGNYKSYVICTGTTDNGSPISLKGGQLRHSDRHGNKERYIGKISGRKVFVNHGYGFDN
ncbi:hypothetical protein [Photobacterium kishitanii]|uniref:Uncharacterized protein n=1 Tax=Photobacterium kishitanii TaxID=318456 RepID=A0A0B7JFG4_9GAMM|nr:hypothetical protein [Photobacterium kishitanii]PSU90846.1 hypothetical protein C0W42_06760 [Photobacterium kishitanii]PSU95473.1 hypothetical protein C0W35_05480 [Photobacterium kishitanii]PSU98062.1 hypothetical protein C9J27_13635 [Photobacterium kishitanii]PSV09230.1 hypothetical protein C0W28_20495 [Photobacterium kishitanii]CEO41851.1 conserved exported hypothetical protein [Photobacterium kishitanii]